MSELVRDPDIPILFSEKDLTSKSFPIIVTQISDPYSPFKNERSRTWDGTCLWAFSFSVPPASGCCSCWDANETLMVLIDRNINSLGSFSSYEDVYYRWELVKVYGLWSCSDNIFGAQIAVLKMWHFYYICTPRTTSVISTMLKILSKYISITKRASFASSILTIHSIFSQRFTNLSPL